MLIEMMKSKIHRVTVTEANLNYIGSITIDQDLLDAANAQMSLLSQSIVTESPNL